MKPTPAHIQLSFGRVHHARLRPVRHAFSYGVYFLRLPLRSLTQEKGTRSVFFSHNRFNILSFWDKDHGDGTQSLPEWVDGVLQREGVHDANGEIWLQTFPRVLGYVFNPVSFWFCHRADGTLRVILAEVNNTFGERHVYLLDNGGTMPYGIEIGTRKIFHVSPFCAVDGHYRFRFLQTSPDADENDKGERTVARIDYDDDDGPLIQTSISGSSQPLSSATIVRAFFTYPLMTFGVMTRIHWQALQLWRKRVRFFSKPSPPSSELSR